MANFTSTTLREYTSSNPFLKDAARVCCIRSSKVITDPKTGEQRHPHFVAFAPANSKNLLKDADGRVAAVYVGKNSEAEVIKAIDNGDASGIQVSIMTAADGRQVPTAFMGQDHTFASF